MAPPLSARAQLYRGFGLLGLAGVGVLTLIDRGATRMHAWPWSALLTLVELIPFILLIARTELQREPVRLPPRGWSLLGAGLAAAVLISALASPHAGPSLRWAWLPLSAIAAFVLIYDWLMEDPEPRARTVSTGAGWFFTAIGCISIGHWAGAISLAGQWSDTHALIQSRNPHPLGHSSYTAGLALLGLPWLGALVWTRRGWARVGWGFGLLLLIAMLLTSGSRGGAIGLCALLAAGLVQARPNWRALLIGATAALLLAAGLILLNPRTRGLLRPRSQTAFDLSTSTVQRTAMATAGWRMGLDRPVIGWGPGTTPQVYPRYRPGLDGGVEDALQLHSTPVQLWAELGGLGIAGALVFLLLALGASWHRRGDQVGAPAAVMLAGYGVFALFDYQLDVPVFAGAVAIGAALLAAADTAAAPSVSRHRLAAGALIVVAILAIWSRPDPAPALNVRALQLAADPRQADAAIGLLRESLASDSTQEIAHFNLGWLLVVRQPRDAESHFLAAARLVPDKGGVYFGLALARLNQRAADERIVHALALEGLNDPIFLTSPWWREPSVGRFRAATFERVRALADALARTLDRRKDPRARDARWVSGLTAWIEGSSAPGEMLALARTPERVQYFVQRPALPEFGSAPVRRYRRERTAYPVLMRNLDLAAPVDCFDVQENALAGQLRFLFPPKGWLPTPLLPGLLESADSAKP